MGDPMLVESVKGLRKLTRDGKSCSVLRPSIAGMMDASAAGQRGVEMRRVQLAKEKGGNTVDVHNLTHF